MEQRNDYDNGDYDEIYIYYYTSGWEIEIG